MHSGIGSDLLRSSKFARRVLTLEEDGMAYANAAICLSNAQAELAEVHRLVDVADTMHDVGAMARTITDTTRNDIFMMESHLRLVLAGSSLTPPDVMTKYYSCKGKKFAMEGFGHFLTSIWEAIFDGLKRVWAWISDFFYHLFGTMPRLRRRITSMREKADKVTHDFRWEPDTEFGHEASALMINGKLPKNGPELLAGMDAVASQTDYFLGAYMHNAEEVYGEMTTLIEGLDRGDLSRVLNQMTTATLKLVGKNPPKDLNAKETTDARFSHDRLLALPPLVGNKTVFLRTMGHDIPGEDRAVDRAEYVQALHVTVADSKERTPPAREGAKMVTPSPSDISALCQIMSVLCDQIEAFERGSEFKSIMTAKDRLAHVTDDVVKKMRDKEYRDPADTDFFRAAVKYNSFLTNALLQPCARLAHVAMSSCQATTVLCERVMSQ